MAKSNAMCDGVYDDGTADGNLTSCSTAEGCGLPGCPHVKPVAPTRDAYDRIYTAKHQGRHLSMSVHGNLIDSQYLRIGETMSYPAGAIILLVVGPKDAE